MTGTQEAPQKSGYLTLILATIAVLGGLGLAVTTGLWTWTALPVGILFGFFLQKGDLCAAAAFSEALMNKDWRKLGAFWIAISVSMALFAIAHRRGGCPPPAAPACPGACCRFPTTHALEGPES